MHPDTDLRGSTGLLDRWNWDERAADALARAGNRAALLLVDLDTMPAILARHGAEAGAAVLNATARVLTDSLRSTDLAGHGGDEFLVLLPARDRQLGELIARRIRSRIRRAIIPIGPTNLTALPTTIGIAVTDPTTSRSLSLPQLLHQADAALLTARTRGGDQILTAGTRR